MDDAIRSLKEVISIDPNFPKAYTELGRAYHKKKMVSEAKAAYKKALSVDPKDKGARFLLNNLLGRLSGAGEQ